MNMTEQFGEPISVYGADQATEDGVLAVVDEQRFPDCRFTAAVHAAIMEKVTATRTYLQVVVPLMQDVLLIARKHRSEPEYTGDELNGNVTGRTLWFAMNDLDGITVMFPEDR